MSFCIHKQGVYSFLKKAIVFFCFLLFLASIFLWFALEYSPYSYKNASLLQNTSFSREVYDRNNNLLRLTLSKDEKYRIYGSIAEVPPLLKEALLHYEDKYFYSHIGINIFSLVRAFYESYIKKERLVGASTLTMQTARLVFDLKTNTLSGKLKQMWYALQLEYYHSKQEILEAYFNLAPYGGNIEGIFAASTIYFHKQTQALTLSEALSLIVIPQNPEARKPQAKDFNRTRMLFQEEWKKLYPQYSQLQTQASIKSYSINDIPFLAPHFTQRVLQENQANSIHSSLDLNAQLSVEESIQLFIDRHRFYGIENASALLVHVPTMEVRAYVGSADYYNTDIAGQIDALKAKRSPGSTLKPFIYALAMEQGLIHEGSILLDIPQSFNGYNPENFNKEYSGPIPAKYALKLSRNIPAVHLANQLKNPNLYEFLKKARIDLKENEKYYGLSLVLGGAEISPTDLIKLYAMLLNQGLYEELNFTLNNKNNSVFSLLSKEVSAVTLTMLEDPLLEVQSQGRNIPIRLKTGTSNGFRDAWAVGTLGEYILLVWIGNFDNSSNPHFIGAEVAVPLFSDISLILARQIPLTDPLEEQIQNLGIQKIKICSETGDTDTKLCNNKIQNEIYYIAGKSPIRDTGILRPILVDTHTGLRVCRKTLENQDFIQETIGEFWSSEMQKYFQEAGIYKESPPPFELEALNEPLCHNPVDSNAQPHILKPQEGMTYYISQKNPQLILQATVNYDSAWAYWFVDGKYQGKVNNNELFYYKPTKENIEITVLDSFGRATKKDIKIKFMR